MNADKWHSEIRIAINDKSHSSIAGDAENARYEIAGHENAAPCCRGGKCET